MGTTKSQLDRCEIFYHDLRLGLFSRSHGKVTDMKKTKTTPPKISHCVGVGVGISGRIEQNQEDLILGIFSHFKIAFSASPRLIKWDPCAIARLARASSENCQEWKK